MEYKINGIDILINKKVGLVMLKCFTVVLILYNSVFNSAAQCNTLVWSDEFDGTSLNANNWSYEVGTGCDQSPGCGWGNNELQYYTDGGNNVTVSGGNLSITPKYQPNYNGSGLNYTSSRIITKDKQYFKYGYMEARIKIPSAQGVWPAFWMLAQKNNWPYTGEIDVMEAKNLNPSQAFQTIHYWCSPCYNHQYTGTVYSPGVNFSSDYHIYAVEWSPGRIQYSIDGIVTATYTPSSLTGGNTNDWTFDDQEFYLMLNVAVGGNYTGTTPISSHYPVSMLVDYVRVYSNTNTTNITGEEKVFIGDTEVYKVNKTGSGVTYNWSVPAGATIVSGQGTSNINVEWLSGSGGNVSVSVDPDGAGPCIPTTVMRNVKTIVKTCGLILDDFEGNRNLSGSTSIGILTVVSNPGMSGSNTSATVGRYERNAGSTYDILTYKSFKVDNPDDFKNGLRYFTMDVRTNAPSGTPITIEFNNTVLNYNNYPSGRHSQYSSTTGAPNVWNKLTFTYTGSPDASLTGADVDKIQILFNPNSNVANQVFYFDNFIAQGVTPSSLSISGSNSVCENKSGELYSVTGQPGSTFAWSVPADATIISGQGTNSIVVDFGVLTGSVGVVETTVNKCVGPLSTKAITFTGSCSVNADFSISTLSSCVGNKITFADLTTGKIGGETYSWEFGPGANPAVFSGEGPVVVTYSTSGLKTISLKVTNAISSSTKTKSNVLSIAAPPANCIFSDHFDNANAQWISPGAFNHSESGTVWTISNLGYPEWENFTYQLNNGLTANPINFSCAAYEPTLQIRARATGNAMLRLTMIDEDGIAIDNINQINLELTNNYQLFTIDYSKSFRNYHGANPGVVDSTNISHLQFYVNPGYVSYPHSGSNATYNTAFSGNVEIDWIGMGNSCSYSSLPVELLNFSGVALNNYNFISWATDGERNNQYFIIERSTDGINFKEIGKVDGNGDQDTRKYYEFKDSEVFKGAVYYRLKQVDHNSTPTTSSAISIFREGSETDQLLSIVPNPSEGNEFTIQGLDEKAYGKNILIINSIGQLVYKGIVNPQSGQLQGDEMPLFLPGMYNVFVVESGEQNKLIIY